MVIGPGPEELAAGLPAALFERADDGDDADFYAGPRLVTHIDDATIAALTDFYRECLPPGGRILDLMSSWISHLPADVAYGRVTGHGMNAVELDANARLDERLVQDLNRDPRLPFAEGAFDAVLICVSVQYLVRPVALFRELARVLAPAGQLVVSMSHRCFPTKAVRAFQALTPMQRSQLVMEYVRGAGGFAEPEFHDRSPADADPLWIVRAQRLASP
ncbi:MAG TPA: methyltransferase domain-containing protein [Pseudomonadales bacterium]|nr:methyltransferase domain-containing protein [Pseudomonadales bacterium]